MAIVKLDAKINKNIPKPRKNPPNPTIKILLYLPKKLPNGTSNNTTRKELSVNKTLTAFKPNCGKIFLMTS